MRNRVIIPLLLLALVISAGWGYSQYEARRQWEINAENQYQRAFAELTGSIGNMETELSKTLVAGSYPQMIRLLTNCWREANSCQQALGQLPLTSLELNETKKFLASAGTFCFNAAQNRLLKGKAPQNEWEKLQQFRDKTELVTRQLRTLQEKFYVNRTRWLEVDRIGTTGAAGAATDLNTNEVTKSFLMLEDGLRRVPDIEFEGNNLGFTPKATGVTGRSITVREGEQVCRKFIDPLLPKDGERAEVDYNETVKGAIPGYMYTVSRPGQDERNDAVCISSKGGHVLWMLGDRTVPREKLNLDQAEQSCLRFLGENGYPGMEVVSQEKFANIATMTCVPTRNDVLHYPEFVNVQVAMDNGEILGFDALPYLTFHNPQNPREWSTQMSEAQIREIVNPHLRVDRIRPALVLDEMYNKVPCYEVSGTQGNDRFLIYYNANTGKEEKIRQVDRNGNEVV